MSGQSDSALMERSKQGDQRAFAEIVERHKDMLVNYLTRLCGSRAKAEDLAQETFLKLYLHAAQYANSGKLSSYLYRIGSNLAISALRKDQRHRFLAQIGLVNDVESTSPATPQKEALVHEAREKLSKEIAALPLRYRIPIVLREIEGLTYDEIADLLDCRTGTIKSRISRGRQRLKVRLNSYFNGDTP